MIGPPCVATNYIINVMFINNNKFWNKYSSFYILKSMDFNVSNCHILTENNIGTTLILYILLFFDYYLPVEQLNSTNVLIDIFQLWD